MLHDGSTQLIFRRAAAKEGKPIDRTGRIYQVGSGSGWPRGTVTTNGKDGKDRDDALAEWTFNGIDFRVRAFTSFSLDKGRFVAGQAWTKSADRRECSPDTGRKRKKCRRRDWD